MAVRFSLAKRQCKLHPYRLDAPGKWRAPKLVFVTSMSDLFHEEVPFEFISQVFDRMADYSQHTYQVLTKRPERMMDYVRWSGNKRWLDHVWAGGVRGESALGGPTHAIASRGAVLHSVPVLRAAAQAAEPGSGRHKLGDRWGRKRAPARKMEEAWAIDIRNQYQRAGVAFFFKQWAGRTPTAGGRELEKLTWDEIPVLMPA